MNSICERCDTRIRLGLCNGRDGDFKFCFRKCGSLDGLKETITTFTTTDELWERCEYLKDWVIKDSLELNNEPYGTKGNMCLLFGEAIDHTTCPLGYVTCDEEWTRK